MNILFVGPQGSGKGTQAKIIAERLSIPHISTGDLLRNASEELKNEVDSHMQSGSLVPDELMLRILQQRLSQEDCKKGFILDGFPRNISQARILDSITKINKVIEITISDCESIRRIGTRLSCRKCGAIFNTFTNPPRKKDICDFCSQPLIRRADDTPEAIKKRLEIYHRETEPILEHYESIQINGEQSIEEVTHDILEELSVPAEI